MIDPQNANSYNFFGLKNFNFFKLFHKPSTDEFSMHQNFYSFECSYLLKNKESKHM